MNPLYIPSDAHRPVDAYPAQGNQAAVDQTLPSPASAPSTSSRQTDTQSNSSTAQSSRPVEELRGYSRPKRPRYYAELQKASQIADPYSPSDKSSTLSSSKSQGKGGARKSMFASSSGSQNYSSGLSEPPLTASSLPERDPRAPSRQGTRKLLKKRQLSLQFEPPAAKTDIIAMCKAMGRNLWRGKGSEK